MFGCGESRRSAWISRRLFTCAGDMRQRQRQRPAPRRLREQQLQHLDSGITAQRDARAHLLNAVELVLHAFYGRVAPCLDALRLEHLRERAFALPRDQAVPVGERRSLDAVRPAAERKGAVARRTSACRSSAPPWTRRRGAGGPRRRRRGAAAPARSRRHRCASQRQRQARSRGHRGALGPALPWAIGRLSRRKPACTHDTAGL